MVFCGVEVHAASRELPVGDWIFAADAGTAGAGWATHFQFRASWGAGGRANSTSSQGHLVNRLSGGCVNWRPGGQVRGHSSGSPRTTAAPPSATTELSASAGLRTLLLSPGASSRSDRCTPPPVASFDFVRSRSSLRVGSDGVVGAGTDCAGSRCLFQLIPAGTTDGGAPADWFHLRSVATGHLVRLAHSSMPSQASWGGASPPLATLKTSAQVRAAKEAASGVCPLSGGGPAGWRYNATLWSPLVRAALAPWAEGGVSPTALDLAFLPAMYPGPAAHGLPGLHVSIRDGRVYVKTNSEYRMPLMLDMLRTVSRRVRLPDVEFVAHLWDHPKVRQEQPLLVLAHYVDEAHRDVAMPAPWSWDERAHAWPQPFTKLRGGCPTPWTQRKPVLYFRGGCNGPTRGWRGPLWRFYPRKYANVLTKRLGGRVDAGTYDHCDSPKLNKHEWGWDEQMEKEMRADGPKRKVDPFSANCQYRYLLHIDGNVASSRLASEMHLGSTIFKQHSFSSEYFYPLLRAWQHFVPVRGGLSDVEDRLAWADAHPADAERIAAAAQSFAREHLHTSSVACYWWQLLSALAELQTHQPRTSAQLGFRPL